MPQSSITPPPAEGGKVKEQMKKKNLTSNDHVEPKQHPGKVHCLKLGPEPEVHNGVLVQLAPHVKDAHDHGVHDEGDGHEECHDHRQEPVEEEHEEVVCGAPIKDARF